MSDGKIDVSEPRKTLGINSWREQLLYEGLNAEDQAKWVAYVQDISKTDKKQMGIEEWIAWANIIDETFPMEERYADAPVVGAEMLREAASVIEDRHQAYGPPKANFARIVNRWNVHLINRYGPDAVQLDDKDVAAMMIDLKVARLEETPDHHDSLVDICGYSACWKELIE